MAETRPVTRIIRHYKNPLLSIIVVNKKGDFYSPLLFKDFQILTGNNS